MSRRRRRVLTPDEEATIRRELARGATDAQAGQAAGVSARKFYDARRGELRDLPRHKRGPRPGRKYPKPPDLEELPVEEIYRRAAALREQWTEEERQARWSPRFSQMPDG